MNSLQRDKSIWEKYQGREMDRLNSPHLEIGMTTTGHENVIAMKGSKIQNSQGTFMGRPT